MNTSDNHTGILLAPNAFKGSLDAFEVCSQLVHGLSGYTLYSLPAGDGGDGTAAILASYLKATPVPIQAQDAIGRLHDTFYYRTGDLAIIELASICGLKLLHKSEYNVYQAHTAGLGRTVNHALENGVRKIWLCVGGSASIDGGSGALQEMGLQEIKSSDYYSNPILEIESIHSDYLKEKFKNIVFTVLCDVDTVLCGPRGAAAVFGPQKGASAEQISLLDHKLEKYASLLSESSGKEISGLKHGGAAGGIAAAFAALLNAELVSGSEFYLHYSGFNRLLTQSKWVITGEGHIDQQSLYGKIPGVIAKICRRQGINVLAVCGSAETGMKGFDQIFELVSHAPSATEAILHPERYFPALCREIKKYLLSHSK
ncbi:glycerate kinase [uncultured Odoribacter sp.]|uniref:glycerate kinase family protein n=1 Tax=uncultured Odoribacter sp. TaxID=876416 RepID=UPI00261F40BE|nr:glycerate kinase [uncultured Odoribacter sp.]